MSVALPPLDASTKALAVLKDLPLWLLAGVASFLLLFHLLPGADAVLMPKVTHWTTIAGVFFGILAGFRLVSLIPPTIRDEVVRREQRRTVHLTLNESQSFWHVSKQVDGSVVTQFALHFMAKNRTNSPRHLLKARVIRPKIRGDVIQNLVFVRDVEGNMYGTAQVRGNHIPPDGLLPVSTTILIRGKPRQQAGRLKTVVAFTDDEGNELRASFELKDV